MPVSYQYDPESKIVYCKITGVIETNEFLAYLARVIADEQIESGFIEIVDFESAENLVTSYKEFTPLPVIWEEFKRKGCKATLVYAPTDIGYGIARMAQLVVGASQKQGFDNFIIVRSKKELETKIQVFRS